jgi:hypothetical protein
VELNGRRLELAPGGELPVLSGESIAAGPVELAPLTITFLTVAANNAACANT